MKQKKKKIKNKISYENQGMALTTPIRKHAARDKKTNVYIPTEAQVEEARAWSEFCKL